MSERRSREQKAEHRSRLGRSVAQCGQDWPSGSLSSTPPHCMARLRSRLAFGLSSQHHHERMAVETDKTETGRVVGGCARGQLTLSEAANRLTVSRWRIQEILQEAGVESRLGPADVEEAQREVDVALNIGE